MGDFKYALRTLRRSPGYMAVAAMTLALGIGANTAIFSLLDQILLRLLPVKNPQQLVLLTMRGHHYGSNWGGNAISHPMFRDFQAHNDVFSGMFCRFRDPVSLTFAGQSERVNAELVSGTYFSVLGVNTILGRAFTPEDDRVPLGHPLAMLTYDYWKRRFGGDPGIVGKNLIVNGHNVTVLGVVQPGFDGVELGYSTKVFIPIMMQDWIVVGNRKMLTDRRMRWVNAFGRLKPGVSITQAKASLEPFMHSMLEMEVKEAAFSHASAYDREQFLKSWMDVLPGSQGRSYTRRELSTPLWVLMATTGVVLLIACANLANLLLARATGRQKEIAVRLAVGASRGRIISQLLTETLSLAGLGGIAGLAIAFWADKALLRIYLPADSTDLNISTLPDFRILVFTLGVTVLTGIVFGLVPAFQTTRPDVGRVLKDEAGAVVGGGHAGLRKTLVVAQVALSLLLLIGAGLFLRSLKNLSNLGPGFPAERLVGFNIDPSLGGYIPERSKIYYQQLTNALSSVPGVESVGLASMRILENDEWDSSMTVEGYTPAKPEDRAEPYMNQISPGYFATLGVPIVAGRDFRMTDDHEIKKGPEDDDWTPTTVMINEKFAKKFFPGRNPLGLHLGFGSDPGTRMDMEIIGIVKDIKYTNLRDEVPEQAYVPYMGSHFLGSMTVYIRTAVDPNLLMPAVRQKVRELDANLPIYGLRTTETQINNSLVTERMIASLSTVFGFLATMLAVIGLYGVMSYTVAQRTREIGIRMALGAEQGKVVWMVMREVLRLIGIGVVAGIPAALALTRVVESQLFGLTGHDPRTLGISTVALTVVACAAGYIPALRASRLDPMKALRYE
ncbi:MAG: multidrug ABC transporter substrate-binding protein [Acidobacteria bacterium]|nr:MAG: multidrug ABC transporter substrate-binding protein [Acidobacteria bacterium 13_2_20CM_58_27]PYT85135.1 MAG: multidrug ABC transporter substrate-binding protein [Acidobacteriota bacterium]